MQQLRSILVADNDIKFLDVLKTDPQNRNFPVTVAHDGKIAQTIIVDRSILLAGIFVSPSLNRDPSWVSVLRCALFHRPATPVYVIWDDRKSSQEFSEIDLKRLGVKDVIDKPLSYAEIVQMIAPIVLSFDASKALEAARMSGDAVGAEASASMEGFVPIRAEDFLSGTKSCFDVYVRLSSSMKYIKLLQAGDVFTLDRIEGYLKKGVTHFYIKKEVQDIYVSYCDHIATALLKSDQAPIDLKISQTLNQGEETLKQLANNGVSEANIRYAAKFVNNLIRIEWSTKNKADRSFERLHG